MEGDLIIEAARRNELHDLNELFKLNYVDRRFVMEEAAELGHLNVLKHLRIFNPTILFVAANRGHLECVKWLIENGCPWDWDTCAAAVAGGHLDVVRYLHSQNCPWDKERLLSLALSRERWAVYDWIFSYS